MGKKQLNKKYIFLFVAVAVVGIVLWVVWRYVGWEFISIDYLRKFTGRLRGLGSLGVLLYLVGFALGTMLALPSLPFAILGGITYGTALGIVYASIGDLLGASIAFIIARYIGRERIKKRLRKNKAYHEINQGVKKEGWRIIILTRMVPLIPHWLQNYIYGLTAVSFKIYALVSLLCIIPGTAAWIIAVNTVGRGRGDATRTMIYLGIAAVVLVAISYLPKWLYKKKILESK